MSSKVTYVRISLSLFMLFIAWFPFHKVRWIGGHAMLAKGLLAAMDVIAYFLVPRVMQ